MSGALSGHTSSSILWAPTARACSISVSSSSPPPPLAHDRHSEGEDPCDVLADARATEDGPVVLEHPPSFPAIALNPAPESLGALGDIDRWLGRDRPLLGDARERFRDRGSVRARREPDLQAVLRPRRRRLDRGGVRHLPGPAYCLPPAGGWG